MSRTVTLILMLLASASASARDIYQQPEVFIKETFNNSPPKPQMLWTDKELNKDVEEILGHKPGVLRIRYWQRDGKTVWILEEPSKEQPITTGIVINNDRIEQVKVLIYRESRGMEVRYPFFTDQYKDAGLQNDRQLDRTIDGISGATLSVRALTKLVRLALYLHHQIDVTP